MSSGRNASSGDGSAVFVNWVERELDDWEAVWQRGPEYLSMRGTHADVLAWGRSQPADHYWIFDGSEFIPLTEEAS